MSSGPRWVATATNLLKCRRRERGYETFCNIPANDNFGNSLTKAAIVHEQRILHE
jgi:hypothetical protein